MRSDERPYNPEEGEIEIDAIAKQWTAIWEASGGAQKEIKSIERREEFAILDPFVRRLPLGAKLLDGGCGMGQWSAYYSALGYPTTGIDVSQPTIEQLKRLFPDVSFAVADIRDTSFQPGEFDIYFSWGTFEHFEEGFGPVTAEAFRVLKPGGRLFVSVPFDNLRHAINSIYFIPHKYKGNTARTRFYQWRLTRGELAKILVKSGFEVEEVKIIGKRQGIIRALHHNLAMPYGWFITRGIAYVLSPFVPGSWFGHMILAIARKPEAAS